jgi:hypothetical protein
MSGGRVIYISAASSLVSVAPPTILSDGVASATITVTVVDSRGNPVQNFDTSNIVLASTGTGNTITQPTGLTNADGVATGSIVSTVAETKTISATVTDLAITATASLVVSAAPATWRMNEPVGLSSSDVTSFTNPTDWDFYYIGSNGSASGYDAAAINPPRSPDEVAHFQVPTGSVPGAFIGGAYPSLNPGNYTKVYTCAWVYISPNATMHPANWKFWYFYGIGYTGNIVFGFKPDGSLTSGGIKVSTDTQGQTSPTTISDSAAVVPRGAWFLLETYASVTDGLWRAWVDGVQVINVTGQTWTENFEEVHLDPYYGGNSPSHTVGTDTFIDVDEAYISWA